MLHLWTVPGNTQVLLLLFPPKLATAAKQEILLAMSKAHPKWKPHESLQKWTGFFWKTVLLMLRCSALLWNPQHLTAIRNHYSLSAACQYHLLGLCPVFPLSHAAEGGKSSCFRGRFHFSGVESVRSQSFIPLLALFQGLHFHTAFHCHHTIVTTLLLLAVIIISWQRKNEILIKESSDIENTQEKCHLWEQQGLRLSEAKAVIKDNAHETG